MLPATGRSVAFLVLVRNHFVASNWLRVTLYRVPSGVKSKEKNKSYRNNTQVLGTIILTCIIYRSGYMGRKKFQYFF